MCFLRTKESKILIAKRDITVYKLGCYADLNSFKPLFRCSYCYTSNKIVKEYVSFDCYIIDRGFHSYITCKINPFVGTSVTRYWIRVTSINSTLHITLDLKEQSYYLGKFIIPKGATYCINKHHEVVSDSIVYTGNYIKLEGTMNFNVKDVWKEK